MEGGVRTHRLRSATSQAGSSHINPHRLFLLPSSHQSHRLFLSDYCPPPIFPYHCCSYLHVATLVLHTWSMITSVPQHFCSVAAAHSYPPRSFLSHR